MFGLFFWHRLEKPKMRGFLKKMMAQNGFNLANLQVPNLPGVQQFYKYPEKLPPNIVTKTATLKVGLHFRLSGARLFSSRGTTL